MATPPTQEAGKSCLYSRQPCAQFNVVGFVNEEDGGAGWMLGNH